MKQETGFVTTDDRFFRPDQAPQALRHQLKLDVFQSYEDFEKSAGYSIETKDMAAAWILDHASRLHRVLDAYVKGGENL